MRIKPKELREAFDNACQVIQEMGKELRFMHMWARALFKRLEKERFDNLTRSGEDARRLRKEFDAALRK
jgi:hypothetical protein